MVKNIVYSFMKMSKDIVENKPQVNFFYDGKNLRFITNEDVRTGSFGFEKGNSLVVGIPIPLINPLTKSIDYISNGVLKQVFYNTESNIQPRNEIEKNYFISNDNYKISEDQIIIGHTTTRENIILFTTDNNGFDCVWKVNDFTFELDLIYMRNMEFSTSNPIQCINNFENISIDKVYWVDNKNQMRFLNINHSIENDDLEELIDLPVNVTNMVSRYNLSQPIIVSKQSGGTHTAGMIQYAYNLYKLNSSQTKLSPISSLISLDKDALGGGEVNEFVGSVPLISIQNIDNDFTNIKVYAIKYTSYNQTPEISLIEDREIPSNRNIELYDDGSVISTLSLEEFTFLGSDIIIPKHAESKDNRLFLSNYKEINFEVDLDMRAYSFNGSSECKVYDSIYLFSGNIVGEERIITNSFTNNHEDKFDSINIDYDSFKFQYDGLTLGGEGKYIKYKLDQTTIFNEDSRYFKDSEIYRIGIEFYNAYGQNSLPIWVADFKSPDGNLISNYNILEIELKNDFYIWLNNTVFQNEYDRPVGYRILLAERTNNDKTIVASGLLSSMMTNDKSKKDISIDVHTEADADYVLEKSDENPKMPNILVRNINLNSIYGYTRPLKKLIHLKPMNTARESSDTEVQRAFYGNKDTSGRAYQYNAMGQIYTPEVLFGETVNLNKGMRMKVKGSYKNTYNANWGKTISTEDESILNEGKSYVGVSSAYSAVTKQIINNPYNPLGYGLVSHPAGSEATTVAHIQFYRGYGKIEVTDNFTINNSISRVDNDLDLISPYLDPNGKIGLINNNRGINIIVSNGGYDVSEVTYTVTPDASHAATVYTLKISEDNEGANIIESLVGVTGTQVISKIQSKTVPFTTSEDKEYYLIIESSNPDFFGTFDVLADVGPTTIQKESLLNAFFIEEEQVIDDAFVYNNNSLDYEIYGEPEITEKGQSFKNYNGDAKYRYTNSLESFLADGDSSWDENGKYNRQIVSINSDGQKCITLVLGENDLNVESFDRPLIGDDMAIDNNVSGDNNLLIVEIIKSRNDIYLGNIYGGNSFEDKKRTNYLPIGPYRNLTNTGALLIESPGDTFVHNFRFQRIVKKDTKTIDEGYYQHSEIIEYKTETTVDLRNRNDSSLSNWDDAFQPKDESYHKYNRVYSQLSTISTKRDLNYNVKKVNSFDTNIIATKLKSPGETIDSWTDILQNEVLSLNGRYGAINGLVSLKGNVFAFQDRAVSFISINPRVQVQASDGIALELGYGQVLQEYKYISTNSGSLNKWGIVPTESGIFYLDLINKSFNVVEGESVRGISSSEGFHKFFLDNLKQEWLIQDNPVLHKGVSIGWDKVTSDVYLSLFNEDEIITLSYNLLQKGFSSFYDYHSSMYISDKGRMFTINPNTNNELYQNFKGDYNIFYEENKKSSISFICNPEPQIECTFNNLEYKSEAINNDNVDVNYTWDNIRAYNEFQNSGKIDLVSRINIRKENRKWRLTIPRDKNKTNRIRNTWSIIELEANNLDKLNYRNNDIVLYYNPNYRSIE